MKEESECVRLCVFKSERVCAQDKELGSTLAGSGGGNQEWKV